MIDFHLHVFPDKIADRALRFLSDEAGGLVPTFDGTVSGLTTLIRNAGMDAGVALPIATRPEQTMSINRFAIEQNKMPLCFFGSIHPETEDIRGQLRMLKDAGVQGIKLHPEYQDFNVDDPHMFPIYEMVADEGLITVLHAGLDIARGLPGRARPAAIAKALPWFHGAPVVAAHFGGYMLWEEVEEHLIGKPLYLDTSYSYGNIPMKIADKLVDEHGADRILFGSDAPWSDPALEAGFVRHLQITDAQKEAILDGNARGLLGMV